MILIISSATPLPGEVLLLQQLLDAGADRLLIRKPGWEAPDFRQFLQQLPRRYYQQILLSGCPSLCVGEGLLGLHCSEQLRDSISLTQLAHYQQQGLQLSTGVHELSALYGIGDLWDQLLLSPVFDSISKPGYTAGFDQGLRLEKRSVRGQVLALGGINSQTVVRARRMQFDGVALMGALWQQPAAAVQVFNDIQRKWSSKDLMF